MKREVSLLKGKFLTWFLNGVAWLFFGVFSMYDNIICRLLAVSVLTISIFMQSKAGLVIKQSEDEMSMYNMMRAKAVAMDFVRIIILATLSVTAIVNLLGEFFQSINGNIDVNLRFCTALILGITDILIGLFFVIFERAGE